MGKKRGGSGCILFRIYERDYKGSYKGKWRMYNLLETIYIPLRKGNQKMQTF